MARPRSFYLPPQAWQKPYVLEGAEARHLLRVVRAKVGDQVRLFDGQGREGLFTISQAAKRSAVLEPVELAEAAPRPPGVSLALGWHKASRREWLLEKAVELHAREILFWPAARSQGSMPAKPKDGWHDKFIAAAKQCDILWLPEVRMLPSLAELARAVTTYGRTVVLWEEADSAQLLDPAELAHPDGALLVLGPEGGLEAREVGTLTAAGARVASLGSTVMRWETAALYGLALGRHARQQAAAKEVSP